MEETENRKVPFNEKHSCLIRVAVVVFIVGVLALASPSCDLKHLMRFQVRARQSEAKVNLGAIHVAQAAYFDQHKTYAAGKDCFDLLDWAPEGNNVYAYYCDQDLITRKSRDTGCPPPKTVPITKEAFTAYAVGNVDKDSTCDLWTIDQGRQLKNVLNDVEK